MCALGELIMRNSKNKKIINKTQYSMLHDWKKGEGGSRTYTFTESHKTANTDNQVQITI